MYSNSKKTVVAFVQTQGKLLTGTKVTPNKTGTQQRMKD